MKSIIISMMITTFCVASSSFGREQRAPADIMKLLIIDEVHRIYSSDKGLEVNFKMHSGIYRLFKKNPKFYKIRDALKRSFKEKSEIKLLVDSTSLEIHIIADEIDQ